MKSKRLVAALVCGLATARSAQVAAQTAQAAQAADPASPSSIERVRAALMSNPPPLVIPSGPDEWHLGVLTFLPPDTPGELIRVRLPIGALAAQAARAVTAAQHRREERAAKEEVARALAAFLNPAKP
jgi:hypothetical protein